jgi:hypothetical protein
MYNQALWAFSRSNLPEQSTTSSPLQHSMPTGGTQLATVISDSGKSGMGMGMIPRPRQIGDGGRGHQSIWTLHSPAGDGTPIPIPGTPGMGPPPCGPHGPRPHRALPDKSGLGIGGSRRALTEARWTPPRAATSGSESPTCFGVTAPCIFAPAALASAGPQCGMMQLLTSANW